MKQLLINLNGIDVTVYWKAVKHLNLYVHKKPCRVTMSVPYGTTVQKINDFLNLRHDWIHKTYKAFQLCLQTESLEEGTHFLGTLYPVVWRDEPQKPAVYLDNNQIVIACREQSQSMLLNDWKQEQMNQLMPELLAKWEAITQTKINSWHIRLMKSRWGTCAIRTKRITLNLKLMDYPIECLEYVIMHELTHLLEKGHNKRFYALMTQFMPNWKAYHDLLRSAIL